VGLRVAVVLSAGFWCLACGSNAAPTAPAWTSAPTGSPNDSATGSTTPLPTVSPTDFVPPPSAGEPAELFFAQFGAVPPPFHVRIQSTLTGFPTGSALEEADVDGRSYRAQLHVELDGVAPHDSQVVYVDGTGYVADAGTSNWQAYPDYDTVPPVNPFIEFDATLWQDMGADASHGGLDRLHSTTWRLPADSASAPRLSGVAFDLWIDDEGLPVSGNLGFQLAGNAGAAAAGYSAIYDFSRVGDPVVIVPPSAAPTEDGTVTLTVTSSAFSAGGSIPSQYTCDGANQALPVGWSGVPAGTAELALILDDPDARGFVHWVVVGIPASASGVGGGAALPAGAREGKNDFGRVGYGGPCPPSGMHQYTVTVYALSAPLTVSATPTGNEVERAATGVTLATATLSGTYTRGG
jgi:Raf kinase inhibitor-like YbhB/YbcL family protein